MTDAPERRLLVVDDNPVNRKLAVALSRRLGWHAREVASGEAGLEALRGEHFDAVLLDISMPGLSGEDVLVEARKDPAIASHWIAAYTAHGQPEQQSRMIGMGFDHVLVKPVNLDTLRDALERAVSRAQAD